MFSIMHTALQSVDQSQHEESDQASEVVVFWQLEDFLCIA